MDLVLAVYKLTRSFPKAEVYGLASQMQRAAVSVPSNIAEGQGLKQTQAYARHLAIANGSLTLNPESRILNPCQLTLTWLTVSTTKKSSARRMTRA